MWRCIRLVNFHEKTHITIRINSTRDIIINVVYVRLWPVPLPFIFFFFFRSFILFPAIFPHIPSKSERTSKPRVITRMKIIHLDAINSDVSMDSSSLLLIPNNNVYRWVNHSRNLASNDFVISCNQFVITVIKKFVCIQKNQRIHLHLKTSWRIICLNNLLPTSRHYYYRKCLLLSWESFFFYRECTVEALLKTVFCGYFPPRGKELFCTRLCTSSLHTCWNETLILVAVRLIWIPRGRVHSFVYYQSR